jgi:archaellum biogenesis ATPase FlaH
MIVEVLSKYIDLQSCGDEYKTCCPFHGEKTPSFTINPEKQFFYCFGCGESGDVFEFVKLIEGCNFKEAVKIVSGITNKTEEEIMEDKENKVVSKKDKPEPLDIEFVKKFISTVGYKSNGYRGIRDDINQFFGHLTKLDENGKVLARYYPETYDDKVTAYTCRNHPKDFSHGHVGTPSSKGQLSGQIKFKTGSKYCLLVGGQEDKAAAYQMLKDSMKDQEYSAIPVVSPNKGENCAKQVAENYDWFDMFDNIIVGMDNDKAGREATAKIVEVLPKDKVKIVTWTGKDPNDMLSKGQHKQFVRDFYNAKEYISSGISSSTDALEGIDAFLLAPKISLPPQMHRIQDNLRGGIRSTGAVVNIIGDTSIGKSFFSDTLFYYWIFNSPIVPTIVSLERTKEELAIDLESLHLKKNLMWFKEGIDAVEYRNHPDVKPLLENLHTNENGEPRYYIIDERDGDMSALKAQMMRAATKYGTKLFIIDPLTDFLRSLGTDVQEEFMLWEKQQKKNAFVFINILHTRKPQSDKDGKVRFVTEYDALGSGTFVQSADINIVLNRDKMADDPVERNTTIVDIPKVRGGVTGRVGGLYYDASTRQQYDKEDWLSEQVLTDVVKNELSEPPEIEYPPIESYSEEIIFNTPD